MSVDLGLLEINKCPTVSCGLGHQQKLIYEIVVRFEKNIVGWRRKTGINICIAKKLPGLNSNVLQ